MENSGGLSDELKIRISKTKVAIVGQMAVDLIGMVGIRSKMDGSTGTVLINRRKYNGSNGIPYFDRFSSGEQGQIISQILPFNDSQRRKLNEFIVSGV